MNKTGMHIKQEQGDGKSVALSFVHPCARVETQAFFKHRRFGLHLFVLADKRRVRIGLRDSRTAREKGR